MSLLVQSRNDSWQILSGCSVLAFQIAVKHFLFFLPIPTAGGETKSKEKNIQEQVRLNNRWVLGGGEGGSINKGSSDSNTWADDFTVWLRFILHFHLRRCIFAEVIKEEFN